MDQVLRKSVGKERSAGTTRFGTRWRSLRKIEEFASNLDGKRTRSACASLRIRCRRKCRLVGLGFQIFSTCSLLSSPSPPLPPFLLIQRNIISTHSEQQRQYSQAHMLKITVECDNLSSINNKTIFNNNQKISNFHAQ